MCCRQPRRHRLLLPSPPVNTPSSTSLDYRAAGVDIDAADELISRVKKIAKSTRTAGVLGGLGGFGALFELPIERYRRPILVSGTDGVGTKLRVAIETGMHSSVGIDLVAMCVNDILVLGAEPLFFLDYYASGKLDVDVAESVIKGIGEGCKLADMALIGGETAELPGMYHDGDYDLAGFCVGVVEKDNIIDGSKVCAGDVLIGLASSGPHSNGFSLIRKVVETAGSDLNETFGNKTLGETLLEPTRIYVRSLTDVLSQTPVHAMAHITGGGVIENLPRVLPQGSRARIHTERWRRPKIFDWIQAHGNISEREMLRTFNCGLGMVLCVPSSESESVCQALTAAGEEASIIGTIEAGDEQASLVIDGLDG
jgi:phosphoribosylformylglycinamidine cyclo-ligase